MLGDPAAREESQYILVSLSKAGSEVGTGMGKYRFPRPHVSTRLAGAQRPCLSGVSRGTPGRDCGSTCPGSEVAQPGPLPGREGGVKI
jgi:hypothetical protein